MRYHGKQSSKRKIEFTGPNQILEYLNKNWKIYLSEQKFYWSWARRTDAHREDSGKSVEQKPAFVLIKIYVWSLKENGMTSIRAHLKPDTIQ
jgi:hypothetical protein